MELFEINTSREKAGKEVQKGKEIKRTDSLRI
jgi:hypothetical protein